VLVPTQIVLAEKDNGKQNSDCDRGSGKERPTDQPAGTGCDSFFEACANAGEKKRRNFGVSGGVKASVNGAEKRLFLRKSIPAGRARSEVRAQFALRRTASGGSFD